MWTQEAWEWQTPSIELSSQGLQQRLPISIYTQIAMDSACSLSQIRKQLLFPDMQWDHIHSNLLEQIVSMIYASPEPICFYKVKAHSGIAGNEVQMQLPNTLPYMTEVMTCTFSLQLQTVMHKHTFTGLRLKTSMRIPAEEGQLHLGFVHSLIKRPSWKQKCANHTDWGVPKQTQGITTTGRTLDLWSINKPQCFLEQ